MSEEKTKVPYLRAVTRSPPRPALPTGSFEPASWQRTLFVTQNENLLAFVEFSNVLEAEFLEIILGAKARYVIDLRLVPRFDTGSLNRKMVFALFAQTGSQYIDMSGELGVRDKRDANLNPGLLVGHLMRAVQRSGQVLDGPIMLLVDAAQFTEEYVTTLAEGMQSLRPKGWDVLRVPVSVEAGPGDRRRKNLVFISHANPEDNDFARWLGFQLSLAGYHVWSDVTKLIGGEQIWTSIEDAIRNQSAKVVIVLSAAAQSKQGVLDEINCAVSVERANGLDAFVIPVRVDDLPFHEVQANLARKNILDFHSNWARGLDALLSVFHRDGVPRAGSEQIGALTDWCRRHSRSSARIQDSPETLFSNWLRIEYIPSFLEFVKPAAVTGAELRKGSPPMHGAPSFQHKDYIVRFSDGVPTSSVHADNEPSIHVPLDDVLKGVSNAAMGLDPATAGRQVVNLLRQSWNAFADGKGLLPYELSSGAIAWYPPAGLLDSDWAPFRDPAGKMRRKYLVGKSEKRNVFWHYAVELQPVIARIRRYVIVPHIVFTEDGKHVLVAKERMHTLRRQFCKNWWNDRWRDLNFGILSWLSERRSSIDIDLGGGASRVRISSMPMAFRSPISVSLPVATRFDELLEDIEWEDLDVVDDDSNEDGLGIADLDAGTSDLADD